MNSTGKKKKSVQWVEESRLKIFHYFELDEDERSKHCTVYCTVTCEVSLLTVYLLHCFVIWQWLLGSLFNECVCRCQLDVCYIVVIWQHNAE